MEWHPKTWTAASLGALIGGGVIWLLEEYVWTAGAPGVLHDLVDWLAPLAGAAVLGWLAARGVIPPFRHPEEPPPSGPQAVQDASSG